MHISNICYYDFSLRFFTLLQASNPDSFSFTLPRFYIIFILCPIPFALDVYFVSFYLTTEFELNFYDISNLWSQARTKHFYLFAVWLESVLALPWVYNFCFNKLLHQMLSLQIGSDFHTFYPRQPLWSAISWTIRP